MKIASGVVLAMLASACAHAQPAAVTRIGAGSFPISTSVSVPPGSRIVYVSGTVPEAIAPDAAAGSVARYGDTEAQTRTILNRIEAALVAQGMGLGDITMMRVYLVAPPGAKAMDFAGMMRAYSERFGTAAQPNKPARSTMAVAGLVDPGWLAEIDVVAARGPGQGASGE